MAGFALITLIIIIVLAIRLSKSSSKNRILQKTIDELKKDLERFQPFNEAVDALAEIQRVKKELEGEQAHLSRVKSELAQVQEYLQQATETESLILTGFYSPKYSFDTSEAYKKKLEVIREKQKTLLKTNRAAIATTTWTVGGSEKEGQKTVDSIIKLMLRAFNGECDTMIAKVKFSNILQYEEKMKKTLEAVNKAGARWSISITQEYLDAYLEELRLVYEYQEKLEEEKEEQRRIKEQIREEEKAQREMEKAKIEAEKEEKRYQEALDKARKELEQSQGNQAAVDEMNAKIAALQAQLEEAHKLKERAISQAQLTKSGHVYVISNIGSFGENVYKIGMTRRLEPLDRVKELGDASVPFEFDVHAIIFSDNAPEMEKQLHKLFDKRRVNRVNEKREFFRVSLDEVQKAVYQISNRSDIEFTKIATAKEYRETLALIEQN